jgi:hypothetical protein
MSKLLFGLTVGSAGACSGGLKWRVVQASVETTIAPASKRGR